MNKDWHQEETYKSLLFFGSNAIKFVLLLNGGAVISLLTFLGNLLKTSPLTVNMSIPMLCFLAGILSGGLSHITAYLTQLKLFNEGYGREKEQSHKFWLYLTLFFVILSLALFGVGSLSALNELQSFT